MYLRHKIEKKPQVTLTLSQQNKIETFFVPSDVLDVQYFQLKFPIGIIPRNLEFHLEFYLHKMKSQGLLYLSCAQPLPQDTNSAANKERIIFPISPFCCPVTVIFLSINHQEDC